MTRRRWIADEIHGNRAAITGQNALHLARVLRARIGQEFDIACTDVVRLGRITAVGDDRVEFELGAEIAAPAQKDIALMLAVFKFDRMEWAIEKCTELGVSRIVPVIAQRTDSHLASASSKRVERWRRIAHEAAQQSRRTSIPTVIDPADLRNGIPHASGVRILLAETEEQLSFAEVVNASPNGQSLTLAIGPEGGWTVNELQMFSAAGWTAASLGNTILRAETAAIAAMAIAALK
jgi:16S rRNA (uracil1498-N3)-methyltransferase